MSMHDQFRLWDKYQAGFALAISAHIPSCYPTFNKTKIKPVPNGFLVRMFNYEDEEVFNKVFPKDVIDKSYYTGTFDSVIDWYQKTVVEEEQRYLSNRLLQAFNSLHFSNISIEDYNKLTSLKDTSRKQFFDNFVKGKQNECT